MRVRHPGRPATRPAFTLIELLVVMTIMVVLATLVYFLLPGMLGREKASKGADLVQQWLLLAKQRALRDHTPRGLRLNVDQDGLVRTLNYIEKPADFTGQVTMDQNQTSPTPPPYTQFKIQGANYVDWTSVPPVQVGDFFYLPGVEQKGAPWHRIVGIGPSNDNPPLPVISIYSGDAYLSPPAPSQTNPTTPDYTMQITFNISRAPRLLEGEATLQMPQDVVIDMRPNWSLPSAAAGGTLDILFSPTGGIVADPTVSAGSSAEKIILWVRDIPQNADPTAFPDPRGGNPSGTPAVPIGTPPADPKAIPQEQSLIVVYSRTGLIAAHPVARNPNNADLADDTSLGTGHVSPYQFAQDGQSSGL